MTEFLQNYEKQYKKTAHLYLGLKITVVALLIGYWVTSVFSESSISTLMLWGAVILTFGNRKIAQAFSANVNTIAFKWMNDMDVAFACNAFEEFDAVYLENQ